MWILPSLHLKGRIETGGLRGTYERWTTARGEYRVAIDLSGALRQVIVFGGRLGWILGDDVEHLLWRVGHTVRLAFDRHGVAVRLDLKLVARI